MNGFVKYQIPLSDLSPLELPEISFSIEQEDFVDSIIITSPTDKSIELIINLREIDSVENAYSIAEVVSCQIADKLAFYFVSPFGDPKFIEGSVEGIINGTNKVIHMSDTLHLSQELKIGKVVSKNLIPEIVQSLKTTFSTQDKRLAEFRWIIAQSDPVARFMHMYNMLLSLKGGAKGTQKKVDEFIHQVEPNVVTNYNDYLKRDETIYTRLRNEIGHKVNGVTPQVTRQNIRDRVGQLAKHLKTAIEQLE